MPLLLEFMLFASFIIGLTAFMAVIMHGFGTSLSKQSKSFKQHLTESKQNWKGIKREH
ncbi:hypothetical protein [Guptibacillus algicola]|uniref:hypothetical protein n=1 Tax=Guptibacillus algicola TaxID=225844 RepID=UPI001CD4980E|nr:hypothetical protein [Alkalihalobacillus algicola]MCA0987817.1 hypothetical protein [Alkalihalobacillus algicola]